MQRLEVNNRYGDLQQLATCMRRPARQRTVIVRTHHDSRLARNCFGRVVPLLLRHRLGSIGFAHQSCSPARRAPPNQELRRPARARDERSVTRAAARDQLRSDPGDAGGSRALRLWRGAFTGASTSRIGALEAAGAGTILLDEIAELPLASQSKLLRVLEDKQFERVGSNRPLSLRARLIVATNLDLAAMVAAGRFRSDLLFRISVVSITLPSLRERGNDVVLLARQIRRDVSGSTGRRIDDFSPAAVDAIKAYRWPGNVRELRNAIEHAIVMGEGPIVEVADLPAALVHVARRTVDGPLLVELPARLDELEARAIDAAMEKTAGNRTKAAALLGIERVTLYNKLKRRPAVDSS